MLFGPSRVPLRLLRSHSSGSAAGRRGCDLRSCVVLDGGAFKGPFKSDTGSGLPAGQTLIARFAQPQGQPGN